MSDQTNYSSQPRFKPTGNANEFFTSTYGFVRQMTEKEPPLESDSRKRDAWLRRFVKKEPNLLGILNTAVDIDKNRGWKMLGGRNQVARFTNIFHSFQAAPGLHGWRYGVSMTSKSFWGSNMGGIIEVGKDGRDGPLRQLYTVDSAKCRLTGDMRYPLSYYPKNGKMQKWRDDDFIRIASLPSDDEDFNGLSTCAVERSLELAELMIAVYGHHSEQLGSQAPRGFLLVKGVSQNQFEQAMSAREADLEAVGYQYYGAVAVLASQNADVDAKLVALSQLPAGFNYREWMDMMIYGYSLIWGFDPSEFWPVQFGAMGRGNETQIQHEKATSKGRLDFTLSLQEQLQQKLPDTISFMFEQRDDQGDLLHAQIYQAKSNVAKTLYEAGISGPEGSLLTRKETRILLADYGIIPDGWSETVDITEDDQDQNDPEDSLEDADHENSGEIQNTPGIEPSPDTNLNTDGKPKKVKPKYQEIAKRYLRDMLMNDSNVVRAALRFPKDAIVQVSYPANLEIELWSSGEDLLRRRLF